MLYLLNKDVRTVRWNGEPLHEATSAIVKETMNGDFTLTVKYPISDSGIYQLIQEDMLIKAPTPVLGAQLFRIKKPVEHNDHLEITAYHISDDVMQRSITPVSVTSQSCGMALSRMVQNTKTALGDFSFNSDIQDRRTFNTTETETLYSVLLDGKHSIVGTWEGELVRDNFAITVKKSRGENRGVVITTHKNLKDYQRTRNSQNVVTRIHAKSTFKPEGAEKETTIRVTVDSPLINSYPYINEKEYENNNAKSVEELQKWAQAKFTNQGIDKVSDAIKIEAYELDGQVVHMGDTVNLKSWKHNVDSFKKAIAYEFDALKEEYISLSFDDKAGVGGSRASGGLSSAADAILGVTETAQEIAFDKALQNADLDFDHKVGLLRQEISDGIELARARAEEVKRELSDTIDQHFNSFNNGPLQEVKRRTEEALKNSGVSSLLAQEAKRIGLDSITKLEEFKRQATSAQTALSGDLDVLKRTIANDIRPKQEQVTAEIAKQVEALVQTTKELAGVKSAQATYEETTTRRLSELTNLANGKASKSELTQTAEELKSRIATMQASGRNLFLNSLFKQDIRKTGIWTTSTYTATIDSENKYLGHNALKIVGQDPTGRDGNNPKITYPATGQYGKVAPGSMTNQDVTISFYAKAEKAGTILRSRLGNIWFKDGDVTLTTEVKRYVVKLPKNWTGSSPVTTNEWLFNLNRADTVWIWMPKFEVNEADTPYSEAPEDVENQISAVESTFKQKADSLEASVSSLREGLNTKADSSALNLLYDRILASVKSLETDTQNKLNQKLSTAEFDVRASGIRQEILNATKDKADKALVTAEAGKLRTELSTVQAYVAQDVQRQEALQRYTREESAKQATAVRELVARDFVGKSDYQEDVRGLERRFSAISTQTNNDIAAKIAQYKQTVDGQFASITSQIADKASQTDFQRVQETSRLYERILGNTNNSISDNIARMALTNQLFQVEVGKYSVNGPNLVKNSDFKNGMNEWASTQNLGRLVKHDFYRNGQKDLMRLSNATKNENFLYSHRFDLERNTDYVLNFRGFNNSNLVSYDVFILGRRVGENNGFTIIKQVVSSKKLSTARCEDVSVTFNSGEMDNAFIRFDNNGSSSGTADLYITEIDLYKGYKPRAWQPHPEDVVTDANAKLEAIRTQMTLLQGSWSVQNINSAGDLISGINLGANGHNRFDGKLTHITGETLIDKAVIKSAMVDKLKTANFEAGSVTTVVLDAEAVTADKVRMDQAFANKLVASNIFTDTLAAKEAFINKLRSVVVTATFLEGFQGKIGGFRFGQYTNRNGYFITGINSVSIGMGNGTNAGANRNAFWANWGESLDTPGPKAWYVNTDGKMYCRNDVDFYSKVDFASTSKVNFYSKINAPKGIWIASDDVNGEGDNPAGGYNAVVWWSQIVTGKFRQHAGITTGSDRKLKENIGPTLVKALDKINALNLVAFDYIKDKTHEEIGLIAQEVLNIIPGSVEKYEGEDNHLTINYSKFVPYLIKAVQELNQKLEEIA